MDEQPPVEIKDEQPKAAIDAEAGKAILAGMLQNPEVAKQLPTLLPRIISKISSLESMAANQEMLKKGIDMLYQQNKMIIARLDKIENAIMELDISIQQSEVETDEPPLEGKEE